MLISALDSPASHDHHKAVASCWRVNATLFVVVVMIERANDERAGHSGQSRMETGNTVSLLPDARAVVIATVVTRHGFRASALALTGHCVPTA